MASPRGPGRSAGTAGSGRSPATAALLTGFGLGAFLDGIVLHQVLQWHHLLSAYRPADDLAGLTWNTFWDGLFHLTSWLVVLSGVLALWRHRHQARSRGLGLDWLAGNLMIGWGIFNVIDQLVFHLALGAHHIRMVENYQVYDWSYTALGVALGLVGRLLVRRATGREPRSG